MEKLLFQASRAQRGAPAPGWCAAMADGWGSEKPKKASGYAGDEEKKKPPADIGALFSAKGKKKAKPVTSLAFRQFFYLLHVLASTPELGPQNLSTGRKFYVESDFHVKNSKFRRSGAKYHEQMTTGSSKKSVLFWGRRKASAALE